MPDLDQLDSHQTEDCFEELLLKCESPQQVPLGKWAYQTSQIELVLKKKSNTYVPLFNHLLPLQVAGTFGVIINPCHIRANKKATKPGTAFKNCP